MQATSSSTPTVLQSLLLGVANDITVTYRNQSVWVKGQGQLHFHGDISELGLDLNDTLCARNVHLS